MIAFEPNEVHLHLEGLGNGAVHVRLYVVEKVSEELVASLEDAQGHERGGEVLPYLLRHLFHPLAK